MNAYVTFFVENFPSLEEVLFWGLPGLVWAYGCLFLAGYLKQYRGFKTGYTRKIFHFLIFSSASAIQTMLGIRMVCLFGAATSMVIFYAVLRGDGNLLYEAMARERDAPHRTYYILAPYCATLIGGVTSNVFFGEAALVGYLVAGLGDAIGEPVGTRFGKHTYHVPSFKGVPSIRSYEGSGAVFLMSMCAIMVAFSLSPHLQYEGNAFLLIAGLALFSTVLEAISPHGWDNAVMQIVPSCCVAWCIGA